MQLYYENETVKLYHGNCLQLNIDKIDHIITDPPYGINFQNNDWDNQFNISWFMPLFKKWSKENSNIILFQGWSNVINTIELKEEELKLILFQQEKTYYGFQKIKIMFLIRSYLI